MRIYEKRNILCIKQQVRVNVDVFKEIDITIYTIVYKIRFMGITFFKIKQIVPSLTKCFYSCYRSSSDIIEFTANRCKVEAILWLDNYKNGKGKEKR